MQLATILRAPFIAPGRRNRKVHWDRALTRTINALGKFEREDWRRAAWLPESLRGFYPKWNNQFSPGGGSDCGCCGSSGTFCDGCTSATPDDYQIDFGNFVDFHCTNCDEDFSGQSYVVTRQPFESVCTWRYSEGAGNCSSLSVFLILGGGGVTDIAGHQIAHTGSPGVTNNGWRAASTDHDCGNYNLLQYDWYTGPTVGFFQVGCTASDPCFVTAL